jgi:hypothetical protein
MIHGMNTLKTGMFAALLAVGTLACGGGNGDQGPIPPQAIRGDVVVTVNATSATGFNGFELTLGFDAGFMVAKMPLATNAGASELARGMVCQTVLNAGEYSLTCANATALTGPDEIASFALEYDDFLPDAGDFDLDCDFVDENGQPAGVGCDFDLAI